MRLSLRSLARARSTRRIAALSISAGLLVTGDPSCEWDPPAPVPDTSAPRVIIDEGPESGAVVTTAPRYAFYSADPDTVLKECRIDAAAWTECASPYTVDIAGLADAAHTLAVRATDRVGNVGEPASRTFVLDIVPDPVPDVTAPSASIGFPVDGQRVGAAPEVAFSSPDEETVGFECSLDEDAFSACSSPVALATTPGRHVFAVRAVDAAGNRGESATVAFRQFEPACVAARDALRAARAAVVQARATLAAAVDAGDRPAIREARDVRDDALADRSSARDAVTLAC
ncbi:hypothetical protein [Nocardioides sp. Leaf374]|uniref:hypothetical protein n=1 Tax=Nocardioides sp. Leaf374 TaxID=2876560 RepID=UPI001E2DB0F0|nr:hypothetical protein [Nocardioides sp. Leaf374]